MERKSFIKYAAFAGLAAHPLIWATKEFSLPSPSALPGWDLAGPDTPVFVYNNWSAYDELSDNVAQTERLAMSELEEIARLKKLGVLIDYYVMDAFWFDKWSGYRTWNKEHWPSGPQIWLDACKENNIKPGMWFSTNLIATQSGRFLEIIPEWKDSAATDANILCMFEGGYLYHLSETLQIWYDRGVRLFKFDFAYFEAVTPGDKEKLSPQEVKEKNMLAFMEMLHDFHHKNKDVLIAGYNGFGGDMENTFSPFRKTVDLRWLSTFDTLYCGDPRFSDVPMMNIWRSQDNYSDHMMRQFEFNGLPLRRIDNCAFMMGKTGTCYKRADHAWKGMLILELARGGWMNVYHGNLELLSEEDARWFAKVQRIYYELQKQDKFSTFGETPGKGKPYGFKASGPKGTLCTVVNPSQEIMTITLPIPYQLSKILYTDSGYKPETSGNKLTIGPEQLVVVGMGEYTQSRYNMGVDKSIRIPLAINKIQTTFTVVGSNHIEGTINVDAGKDVRILVQQFDASGTPHRSWGGAPPEGKKMDELIKIIVRQNGKEILLRKEYDKMIWSGLSWGAAEINHSSFNPRQPLQVTGISTEKDELKLEATIYTVSYELG